MDGEATVRSDGSVWIKGNSNVLSKLGVDFLNNFRLRTEVVDDGSKSGGASFGWTGTHGDLSHEFTCTLGNRVSRFEEFATYAYSPNMTYAVAAQG